MDKKMYETPEMEEVMINVEETLLYSGAGQDTSGNCAGCDDACPAQTGDNE